MINQSVHRHSNRRARRAIAPTVRDIGANPLHFYKAAISVKVLKYYDTLDSNFTRIESFLLEIQKSETIIYDFVNKSETQVNDHHKLLSTLKDQLDIKEAVVTPMSTDADTPTTDSVTSLANNSVSSFTVSIVDEQNEREKRKLNLIFHNVTES